MSDKQLNNVRSICEVVDVQTADVIPDLVFCMGQCFGNNILCIFFNVDRISTELMERIQEEVGISTPTFSTECNSLNNMYDLIHIDTEETIPDFIFFSVPIKDERRVKYYVNMSRLSNITREKASKELGLK